MLFSSQTFLSSRQVLKLLKKRIKRLNHGKNQNLGRKNYKKKHLRVEWRKRIQIRKGRREKRIKIDINKPETLGDKATQKTQKV